MSTIVRCREIRLMASQKEGQGAPETEYPMRARLRRCRWCVWVWVILRGHRCRHGLSIPAGKLFVCVRQAGGTSFSLVERERGHARASEVVGGHVESIVDSSSNDEQQKCISSSSSLRSLYPIDTRHLVYSHSKLILLPTCLLQQTRSSSSSSSYFPSSTSIETACP